MNDKSLLHLCLFMENSDRGKGRRCKAVCGDLEKHAYSVNDTVADATLRNMHVLAGV